MIMSSLERVVLEQLLLKEHIEIDLKGWRGVCLMKMEGWQLWLQGRCINYGLEMGKHGLWGIKLNSSFWLNIGQLC